jgi:hypothetical protein
VHGEKVKITYILYLKNNIKMANLFVMMSFMTNIYRMFSVLLLQITKLKIDSNPFAKGFRDSSRLTEFER